MKLKKITELGVASVVSLSSLLAISIPLASAATISWSGGGGADTKFSTAANWVGGVVPTNGSDLVFNSVNSITATNDLSGASFNTINFSGSNSNGAYISGNGLTLTSGIVDSATGVNREYDINAPVIVSGNQSISVAATNTIFISGNLSGSGNVTVNAGTGGVIGLDGDNSAYMGAVDVKSGLLNVYGQNSIAGPGMVSIGDGSSISFLSSACSATTASVFTIGNLSLVGAAANGISGWAPATKISTSEVNCLAAPSYGEVYGTSPNDQTYALNGIVNLGSDVNFGSNGLTTTLTGSLTGAHKISLAAGYPGTFVLSSQTNNSQTANGSYAASVLTRILSDNQSSTTIFLGGPVNVTIDGSRGNTTLESGATLNGSGIVADLQAKLGSVLAPGHSPGCLATGNFSLSGTYQAQIGGTDPCTGYDQLKVTGTVNLGTYPNFGTLETSLYGGFVPKVGQSYTIISNDAADAVTGTFKGLAEGALFAADGVTYKITYKGGDGNDVVLTVTSVNASNLPKTPNTGFNLVTAHPLLALGTTVTAALALLIAARKFKPVK